MSGRPAPFHDTRGPLSRQGTSFRRASLSSRGLAPPCLSPLHPYPSSWDDPFRWMRGLASAFGPWLPQLRRGVVDASSSCVGVDAATARGRPNCVCLGTRAAADGRGWLVAISDRFVPARPSMRPRIHPSRRPVAIDACVRARSVRLARAVSRRDGRIPALLTHHKEGPPGCETRARA